MGAGEGGVLDEAQEEIGEELLEADDVVCWLWCFSFNSI